MAYDLGLQGLSQQIAVNSLIEKTAESRFCLYVPAELNSLISDTIQQEIHDALATIFGTAIQLQFIARSQQSGETPQQSRTRINEENRQQAIIEIKNDPLVRKLQRMVGAELVESSVRLIEESKL